MLFTSRLWPGVCPARPSMIRRAPDR